MRRTLFCLVLAFVTLFAQAAAAHRAPAPHPPAVATHHHGTHHLPALDDRETEDCTGSASCVSAPAVASAPSEQPTPRAMTAVLWSCADHVAAASAGFEADPPPPRIVS